jgi:hypothetical protein
VTVYQRLAHSVKGTLPTMRRHSIFALCACVFAVALAGCGGGNQEPAVRGTLSRFVAAIARQDYATLCQKLLAPSLVQSLNQINLPCEIALSRGFSGVRQPKLVVRSVRVDGDQATASVHTSAANQQPLDGTIKLRRIDGRWRVASLATPGG